MRNMKDKKNLKKQLKTLSLGDLISASWFDASVGKSRTAGPIDVPVTSWGVFIGILGKRNRHIILAQNTYQFSDGIFDIDYTAIPLSWTVNVSVLIRNHLSEDRAQNLLNSFIMSKGSRALAGGQKRVRNHEGSD